MRAIVMITNVTLSQTKLVFLWLFMWNDFNFGKCIFALLQEHVGIFDTCHMKSQIVTCRHILTHWPTPASGEKVAFDKE